MITQTFASYILSDKQEECRQFLPKAPDDSIINSMVCARHPSVLLVDNASDCDCQDLQ